MGIMEPETEECDRKLERWLTGFSDAGIMLTALAVIRRGESTVQDACRNIARYTSDVVKLDEARLADVMNELVEKGHLERTGDRYAITLKGKTYMYKMIKRWNMYVDAMDNLWGCYYGS